MPKINIEISDEGESEKEMPSKKKFGKSEKEPKGKFEDKPADEKMSSEVADKMKNKDHFAPHLDHSQIKSSYPGDKITGSK